MSQEDTAAIELLSRIMDFIEAEVLVRNTSHDNDEGWAMKQLPFVLTLSAAQALVDEYKAKK